jgi:hypothetical protein
VYLLLGQFQVGLIGYEWRYKDPETGLRPREPRHRLWSGQVDLGHSTLLLFAEQGIGDTLQFFRYALLLARQGVQVIMEVQKPLVPFLCDLDARINVLELGASLPPYDWHCPLMSLPSILGVDLDSIPFASGYLNARADHLAYWLEFLGEKQRPRIGLCMSGQRSHGNDSQRSIPWNRFQGVLNERYEYFLLQIEVRPSDALGLMECPMVRKPEIQDFRDTAALASLMDVVVTVDTSVAHLSGALGVPTWVLLPYIPDWRWLVERQDSPWYQSIRLFRQSEGRSWEGVINRVADALDRQFGPCSD